VKLALLQVFFTLFQVCVLGMAAARGKSEEQAAKRGQQKKAIGKNLALVKTHVVLEVSLRGNHFDVLAVGAMTAKIIFTEALEIIEKGNFSMI
jgi:hypothetical protein